ARALANQGFGDPLPPRGAKDKAPSATAERFADDSVPTAQPCKLPAPPSDEELAELCRNSLYGDCIVEIRKVAKDCISLLPITGAAVLMAGYLSNCLRIGPKDAEPHLRIKPNVYGLLACGSTNGKGTVSRAI